MNSMFLIDSDTFIASSQRFYCFSCVPGFWTWLSQTVSQVDSHLIIPHCVYEELTVGKDELSLWAKNFLAKNVQDERLNPTIWNNYAKIMKYINDGIIYTGFGAVDWSKPKKADPKLIAIAMTYGYKIVTFEQKSGQFVPIYNAAGDIISNKPKQKNYNTTKEPKIPDVAEHFGVQCVDLYDLEKKLSLSI